MKKLSETKSAIGPLLGEDGKYIVESKGMANERRKQYPSVFSTPLSVPVVDPQLFDSEDPSKPILPSQHTISLEQSKTSQ